MIPTFFTTLALGSITNMLATITALSTFIAGSAIMQGNLFFDTTNNTTPKEFVNTVKVREMSESGVTLFQGGLARGKQAFARCTATGGLTEYSTCYLPAPITTTGSLLAASLECGNVPKQLTGDVSFKLTRFSSSGTVLTNLNNIVAGTGSLELSSLATEQAWNPANALTFSTLITPGSDVDCRLWATYDDKYGS